ncbi:DUF2165 domain-containing protein [Paenibacillus sp. UMB4589-SE434]|uniref:DUF2165 family protein n=1 Tax=Paenibacillus sp. UMB4589-SE434 TaxID=3046314 RepID=UPI00254D3094|nr:DUF2165 domain-containing protein [Paenibacillus sp. UMB4589-SE434]MDK8183330.1 DUF2165 domain-containing protein [Paenibacillus sp. UMB4589-SE434]
MSNLTLRYLKVLIVFFTALFGTAIFAGNLMDYYSNYMFVQHVLSMDTTFDGNALMWRSITSPILHTVAYVGIIAAEGLFSLFAWIAAVRMLRNVKQEAKLFNNAKTCAYIAYMLAFSIWFFGFAIVGSEWFAMWQSDTWNGKQTAMDITEVMIGFVILVSLRDKELIEA